MFEGGKKAGTSQASGTEQRQEGMFCARNKAFRISSVMQLYKGGNTGLLDEAWHTEGMRKM